MAYRYLLFDFDHTLFDTTASERQAFATLMGEIGVAEWEAALPPYQAINQRLWRAAERGEITPDDIAELRFAEFNTLLGITADPAAMGARFRQLLGAHGELYPGVPELLDSLAASAELALVTNAISEVQRARLARLGIEAFFAAIVISTEIGEVKPSPRFFDIAFDLLDRPPRAEALMIGDNLTSDIAGGVAAGIDTCWYNPSAKVRRPDAVRPTHEISALEDLPTLVLGSPDASGSSPHRASLGVRTSRSSTDR